MCVGIRWSNVAGPSSVLLAVVCVAACGTGGGLAARYDDLDRSSLVRGAACDRSDQDTTRYLHAPLYRACAVTLVAQRIANDMRPELSQTGRSQSCYLALVEVVVDTLGRPELQTARLVRANDPGFGAEVLALVPGLRFQPARLGGRRVRQIYQLREVLRVPRMLRLDAGGRQRGPRGATTMPSSSSTPASEAPTVESPGPVC